MSERRKTPRHRTFKSGTIAFSHGGGVSCIVRNISDGGACLEVESLLGIPDQFTLVIENDHVKRSCHVTWKEGKRIGIEFG